MLNLKWNMEDALQAAYEDGYAVGYAEGYAEGIKLGETCFIKLLNTLIANGKQEELQMALNDKSKRNEYFKKYGII